MGPAWTLWSELPRWLMVPGLARCVCWGRDRVCEPARREPLGRGLNGLPIDSDVEVGRDRSGDVGAGPFDRAAPRPLLRLHAPVVAAVFVGGCVGGVARYGLTTGWKTPLHGFPWATLAVNTSGAFALALLVVLVLEVLRPTAYLRPAIGTGFLGAYTTFSAVTVDVDQLIAHGHVLTGLLYLLATMVGGLAAASIGLVIGRSISAGRARKQQRTRSAGEA
jgi:CrcB protein